MGKRICVLDEYDARHLRDSGKVDCRRHRHITRAEARVMVLGGKRFPWHNETNHNPIARWADLPDGKPSSKHVVLLQSWEWRKSPSGGFMVMQLLSQARSR